jgi:hypothetical protein
MAKYRKRRIGHQWFWIKIERENDGRWRMLAMPWFDNFFTSRIIFPPLELTLSSQSRALAGDEAYEEILDRLLRGDFPIPEWPWMP